MSIQSKDIAKLAAEALEPTDDVLMLRFDKTASDLRARASSFRRMQGNLLMYGEGQAQTDEAAAGQLDTATRIIATLMRAADPAIPTETGQGFSGVKAAQSAILRIMAATEGNTNSATARDALSWCKTVAHTALDALSVIDIPAPAGGEEAVALAPVTPDLQWGKQSPEGSWLACNSRDKLIECTAHFEGDVVPVTVEMIGDDLVISPAAPDHHLRVEVERQARDRSFFNGGWDKALELSDMAKEVERLRADLDAANEQAVSLTLAAESNKQAAIEAEEVRNAAMRVERDAEARATTAEMRIAELEAANGRLVKRVDLLDWMTHHDRPLQLWREADGQTWVVVDNSSNGVFGSGSSAEEALTEARSALASSNKPVEEGR